MITRSQKRKAVAELASGFEASTSESKLVKNCVEGPSNSPKIQSEKLDEIKTFLRREIISELTKFLAQNQKENIKLIAPVVKNPTSVQNLENSDSESKNVLPNSTSTPSKTKVTTSKTTPVNSCNMVTGVLIDSTNQPAKEPN